jgi:uncharacterized protein YaiE (UPF0345 family)
MIITDFLDLEDTKRILTGMMEDHGTSEVKNYVREPVNIYDSRSIDKTETHKNILMNAPEPFVFSYIERLMNYLQSENTEHANNRERKIQSTLEEEGILYDFEWTGERYEFRQIANEIMEESDGNVSKLLKGSEDWQDALDSYNTAYDVYLEGDYDTRITQNLYNALEEVCKTICVDLEGWEDNRELTLGNYIQTLDPEGFFDTNNAMKAEVDKISGLLQTSFSKVGSKRNDHIQLDRYYSTLLIHQTAAFIYFLVNIYESEYRD